MKSQSDTLRLCRGTACFCMIKIIKILRKSFEWGSSFFIVLFCLPFFAFAADRALPFTVGETVDPGVGVQPCGPLDVNCFPSLNILPPIGVTPGSAGVMAYQELLANGTNTVAFRAPDTIAINVTWTLPGVDGLNNQVLTTNGGGVLTWTSVAGGGPSVGGTGAIQFANGVGFDGDINQLAFVGGNFGIGTSSPFARLSVSGDFFATGTVSAIGGVFAFATTTNATSTNFSTTNLTAESAFFTSATTSNLSVGQLTTISSSTFGNGINLSAGCFAIEGICLTTGSGSGTVNSGTLGQFAYYSANGATVSGTSSLMVSPNGNIGIGTSTPYAKLSVVGEVVAAFFTSTTTATSTFLGGLQANVLNVTSTTASSTFANGINLSAGCFAINGTCLSAGGGGSAVGGTGAVQFASGATFAGDATNLFWDNTNQRLGIGTSTPSARLMVSAVGTSTGTELITNGTFTGSAAGWALQSSCSSYGTNNAVVIYDIACQGDAGWPALSTNFNTVAGKSYVVTFTLSNVINEEAYVDFSFNGIAPATVGFPAGTHTVYFDTNYTGVETVTFESYNWNTNGTWTIDDVSIKEVIITPAFKLIGYNGERLFSLGDDLLGNSFLGMSAGRSNGGGRNSGFGEGALYANITGRDNFAGGYRSMYSNTTGYNNTAIGTRTLYANTSGFTNIAVGVDALNANTSGNKNIAIGYRSLLLNTTGFNNIAVGESALTVNTTGFQNTAVGNFALASTQTGYGNTAVGLNAHMGNLTGIYNVAIGMSALSQNTAPTSTVAIGYEAGYGANFTPYRSEGSVFVGDSAGRTAGNNSNYNTFLGYKAGYNVASRGYNILIGQNTDLLGGNATLNIGSVIFGVGMYDGSVPYAGPVSGSKIGIGSSLLYAKLSVQDNYGSSTVLFDVATTTSVALATSSLFRVNANGTVGIGTSSPWRTLSVQGGVALNGLTVLGATGDALCIVAGGEVERNVGATSCLVSSKRFKQNISYTDALNSLAIIMQLRPASYEYKGTTEPRLGLIAEDVELVESRLVARNASGTPQSVRYEELTSVLAGAVQAVNGRVLSLEAFVSTESNVDSSGKSTFLGELVKRIKLWLSDASNDIDTIIARVIRSKEVHTEMLCVGAPGDKTCVTKSQLDQLLLQSSIGAAASVPEILSSVPVISPTLTSSSSDVAIASSTDVFGELISSSTDLYIISAPSSTTVVEIADASSTNAFAALILPLVTDSGIIQ